MAEGVVTFLLEKVVDFGKSEISKVANAERDLARLQHELKSIQPILRLAHVKLFTLKSEDAEDVKEWMLRLNDVAYDVLDLIDFYRVKRITNTNNTKSKGSKVHNFLKSPLRTAKNIALRGKMSDKIKEINERLSVLYNEKDVYGFHPMGESGSGSVANMNEIWERRQTTANIVVSKMIGREEDQDAMVKWLLEGVPEKSCEPSVSVTTIVGMGGMGKTTLAKAIYNSDEVLKCFDKRMWVCVSEKPLLKDLFKKILEEVGQSGFTSQFSGLNACSSQIINHLQDKKFLLVLDDVWDCEWWEELTGLWRGVCRSGSKILITTRDKRVADSTKSDHLHQLEALNSELSWQLFVHETLRKGESEQDLVGVREIGEGIVKKCGGLPLALCTVGAAMCRQGRNPSAWRDVLNSPFWSWKGLGDQNKIFSAIAVSYMNIPFCLKQCLTYCCIFPKDFPMRKDDLLRLWMAEGFVGNEERVVDMEGLAENYLEELVACNLIRVGTNLSESYYYVLHDMVHDFALYIRGQEHTSVDSLKRGVVSEHARVCTSVGEEGCFETLPEQRLRSLVLPGICSYPCPSFSAFKWLRVLDLRKAKIHELPGSIGELVLLRYLSLSEAKISELPDSILQLHDLQTLDLSRSQVKRLPYNLSCFPNMRHLDLVGATRLKYLPKEIRKLTSLRTLGTFVVGSKSKKMLDSQRGSTLTELGDLNNLRGSLLIRFERIGSWEECRGAQLQEKRSLETLGLSWGRGIVMEKDLARNMENIYKDLEPPSSILEICVENYPGIRLPSNWMLQDQLEVITLRDSKFLEHLPNFGYLPKLKALNISGACNARFEWFGRFPRLEKLHLSGLSLMGICLLDDMGEKETMPSLQSLVIKNCPKLRVLPIFPVLEELRLEEMKSLEGLGKVGSSREWPRLKTVEVWGCPKLKFLPSTPVLERLYIVGCDELLELPFSPTLCSVAITDCEKAYFSWTAWNTALRIKEIQIENSANAVLSVVERIPYMKQLEFLRIQGCCSLTSLPDVLQLPRLRKLVLRDLPHLESVSSVPMTTLLESDLQKLQLGPNLGSFVLGAQDFLRRVAQMAKKLRLLSLLGFDGLDVLGWFPNMRKLEWLCICPQLVRSLANALTRCPRPKELRWLSIANKMSFFELDCSPNQSRRGTMLTCSLEIDSLETSNMLGGLADLSSTIDALEIRRLSGILDSLPEWMQQLNQLQNLEVCYSDNLTHLPDWMGNFTKLRRLKLSNLLELSSLPIKLGSLHQLEEIIIDRCPKLSFLPDWVPNLPRLQKATISDCTDDLVKQCHNDFQKGNNALALDSKKFYLHGEAIWRKEGVEEKIRW